MWKTGNVWFFGYLLNQALSTKYQEAKQISVWLCTIQYDMGSWAAQTLITISSPWHFQPIPEWFCALSLLSLPLSSQAVWRTLRRWFPWNSLCCEGYPNNSILWWNVCSPRSRCCTLPTVGLPAILLHSKLLTSSGSVYDPQAAALQSQVPGSPSNSMTIRVTVPTLKAKAQSGVTKPCEVSGIGVLNLVTGITGLNSTESRSGRLVAWHQWAIAIYIFTRNQAYCLCMPQGQD